MNEIEILRMRMQVRVEAAQFESKHGNHYYARTLMEEAERIGMKLQEAIARQEMPKGE